MAKRSVFTLQIKPALLLRLKRLAKADDVSVAHVIRRALKRYVQKP